MRRLIILSGTLATLALTTACPGREDAPPPPPPTADPAAPVEPAQPAEPMPGDPAPATPEAEAPPAAPPAADPAPPAAPPATPPAAAPGLPPGVTTAMVEEGQRLYNTLCMACHGQNGAGTPIGPALNDQQWIHITGEFEEIVNITVTGVAQPRQYPGMMPPRGGGQFTDDQIRAISAYVYRLSHGG